VHRNGWDYSSLANAGQGGALSINFPDTALGSLSESSVAVENVGNQKLLIDASSLIFVTTPIYSFTLPLHAYTCLTLAEIENGFAGQTTVAPGASCALVVDFQPNAQDFSTGFPSTVTDSLAPAVNDENGGATINLSGPAYQPGLTLKVSGALVKGVPTTAYGKPVTVIAKLTKPKAATAVLSGTLTYWSDTNVSGAQTISLSSNSVQFQIPAETLVEGQHTVNAQFTPAGQTSSSASASSVFMIATASLVARCDDQTRTYGDPNPTFTGSVSGTLADQVSLTCATTAGPTTDVGVWDIVPTLAVKNSGDSLANYQIQTINGKLAITRAAVVIAPVGGLSKVYGTTLLTPLTGVVSPLRNSDALTVTYTSLGAPATAHAGSYNITVDKVTFTSGSSGNYNVALDMRQQGALNGLTVTAAPAPSITVDNQTKTYGQKLTNSSFRSTITDLLNGDRIKLSYSSAGSPADAPVTNPLATDPFYPNYTIGATAILTKAETNDYAAPTITAGDLTISPVELIAKAPNKSVTSAQASALSFSVKLSGPGAGVAVHRDDVYACWTPTPASGATYTYPAVGTYTTTVSFHVGTFSASCSPTDDTNPALNNYNLSRTTGTLTVSR
jgi:hypothetical protein